MSLSHDLHHMTPILRYYGTRDTTHHKRERHGCTNMRLTPSHGQPTAFPKGKAQLFSVTKRAGGAVRTPAQFVFFQIPVHPSK